MTELTQTTISGETQLYRRYQELGRTARDAGIEREKIRDEEIAPLIDSGVVIGEDGRYLKYGYQSKVDFDWERAIFDGVIPQDKVMDYVSVKTVRVLRDTSAEETEQAFQARLCQIKGAGLQLFQELQEAARVLFDAGLFEGEIRESIESAINRAGGEDATAALESHLADVREKIAKAARKAAKGVKV